MEAYGSVMPWVAEWMKEVRDTGKVPGPCPATAEEWEAFKAKRAAVLKRTRDPRLRTMTRRNELARRRYASKDEIKDEIAACIQTGAKPSRKTIIPVRLVLEVVAEMHGYSAKDLLGYDGRFPVKTARNAAFYWCKRLTRRSYPYIGKAVGRDHSTVISGVRRHCERNGLPKLED